MKLYIMTDLEGVAGVVNFEDWCHPGSRYYEMGKEFLTQEVNAAVDGFFAGGAEEVLVADGHGAGAINPKLLDSRAQLLRGWGGRGWPLLLDAGYDAVAWVGQHAKAGTEYAHLAHTQGFGYVDLSVNDLSIGELGQFGLCGSELGVRAIFASGDLALTKEAEELYPGIETVAVKRGTTPGRGDDLTGEQYAKRNISAIHFQPEAARRRIRQGALRAIIRAQSQEFGIRQLDAPFERIGIFRTDQQGMTTVSHEPHPTSFIGVMNMPFDPKEGVQ